MKNRFDVIVAGLGAMGSATAYHLARRGCRVLGLDRWSPGHVFGSSHGDSRIIRELYFEHPMYVPIVQRAYELWAELEERGGDSLLQVTGGLMIGPPDGELVAGTRRSGEEHGIPYEVLSTEEIQQRFPAFDFEVQPGDVAVFDPRAGYLAPERCNATHLALARQHGATLGFEEPILSWTPDGGGVRVTTPAATYVADHLVISAGAWVANLLPDLQLPLSVERQVLFWFDLPADDARYQAPALPIYACEYQPGQLVYGFPRLPLGCKAAIMHSGEVTADPDEVRRSVGEEEVNPLRHVLRRILPELAAAPLRASAVCLFTNTPDLDFVLDFHPAHPQVLVSSPCSGHGFKFASAIGEIQADLLMEGRSRYDLAPFRLERFSAPAVRRH